MQQYVNEKVVMQFFIDQAEQDNIIFLQNHEKEKAEICSLVRELMQEETMNRKIQIACKLWKKLFAASMSYISPDRQGYDKIFKYYDAYVEFEELIFASDSFYRDHTLHSIWVYFLGEYLHRNEEFHQLFVDEEMQLKLINAFLDIFQDRQIMKEDNYRRLKVSADLQNKILRYDEASRCVSSLTHDLGYPLKKIEKINKSIQKVMPYFSIQNAEEFTFEYSNVQKNFVDQFLEFLCRELRTSFDITEKSEDAWAKILNSNPNTSNITGINEEGVNRLSEEEKELLAQDVTITRTFSESLSRKFGFSSDFEEYRHGIMSAFLLCKNLQAFQDIDYHGENGDFRKPYPERMLAMHNIMVSVALHTSDVLKIAEINDTNYLTFVDELEEFSRISRASQNREYVKEFCDTRLYMEDGWLNIVFEFSNANLDNLDPEISFRGRCKRFLTLFDIQNLSDNLKLRVSCVGKLPNNQNTYTLEIANRYVDIRINGESVEIPKYLKSNQFYTKEEYAAL
ncbi:MAG: hypothetical protein ACI4AB_11845 [Acetatifactor sp.]